MKPRIAVTTSRRSGWRVFPIMALNVWLAGGKPVRWVARKPADVDAVDGLIIGGGDDIAPDIYGGTLVAAARLDKDRDAMERALVCEALRQGKPVLGICRGAQMINVALGGTLDQDAYGTYTRSDRHWTVLPRKRVNVLAGTILAELMGRESITVNALHNQAVERLGEGLCVAARDRGGMVQAIERRGPPLMLGVQWHPEHLVYQHRQRALFRSLVAAAGRRHRIGTAPAPGQA